MTLRTDTRITARCGECGFTTSDLHLAQNHSCEVQEQGGRCEDFPCCGHEYGDCNGERYGSDESIKQQVYDRWDDPDIDPMDPQYDFMYGNGG